MKNNNQSKPRKLRPADVLVCFAVKEEAKFFIPSRAEVLVTGIGRRNAGESLREAIDLVRPQLVLTCGFAGGLNPELPTGAIVFDEDMDAGLGDALLSLGAIPVKFYCAKRVAVTAAEKQELWRTNGADVVEMESSVIRNICRQFEIPSATIRVISDAANEDLPLDFNALMTSDDKINYSKLAWTVMTRPNKIPKLIQFQRVTLVTAQKLAGVLNDLLSRVRLH
jgi:adenosylhomocysteine nucleosidase